MEEIANAILGERLARRRSIVRLMVESKQSGDIRAEVMNRCLNVEKEAAIKACTAVIQLPQAWPSEIAKAYANRGAAYSQMGNGELAIKDIEQAIVIDPSLPEAFALRAAYSLFHWNNGYGPDSAIDDLTRAINMNPEKQLLCQCLVGRGYSYELSAIKNNILTHRDLAIEDFSQVIRLCAAKTFRSQAFYHRGLLYRTYKHQYQAAIDDFTNAIKIDPGNAEALYNRSLAENNLGQSADGERDMQAARRINPNIDK